MNTRRHASARRSTSGGPGTRSGARSGGHPPRGSAPESPTERLLALQASAGNSAVASAMAGGSSVQRSSSVSDHGLSASEQADLPTVADAPGLVTELAELDEKATAAKDTGGLDPKDEARRAEIRRKLAVRLKGDEAETLSRNGIKGGTDAWFAEVKAVTFLGRTVTVHRILAERLKLAEDALAKEAPPPNGWLDQAPSGLREPGQSLHSFGLAIDINPSTNPWLINPRAAHASSYENTARSTAIRDIIDRAVLLVEGRIATEADLPARPDVADKDARVEASYDKLATASNALARYFELGQAVNLADLEERVTALAEKNPRKRTPAQWARLIAADKRTLAGHASAKSWSQPETGFLHIDKRLVKALTDSAGAGLTWLGDDTIAAGRDIMHFDTRGVGPITRIWNSARGSSTGLGDG